MTITMSVPKGSSPMTEAQAESEHEFVALDVKVLVGWNGFKWAAEWVLVDNPKVWKAVGLSQVIDSMAAEIARLKGLVPPGGEGES